MATGTIRKHVVGDGSVKIFAQTTGAALTVNLVGGYRGWFVVGSYDAPYMALYIVGVTSGGVVRFQEVYKGSGITITAGVNAISFNAGGSAYVAEFHTMVGEDPT